MTDPARPAPQPGEVAFGVMFFASATTDTVEFYQRLLELARLADERGLRFISTPERHFHPFGGAFPNPAVLSAAIAAVTHRLEIRAGSLIAPLHQVIRIIEDWSVVDNLSNGRVAIAFGTGWNINDFVLAPAAYADRREALRKAITAVRAGWQTGVCTATNPAGKEVTLELYPRPARHPFRAWLTVSRSCEGYEMAAQEGLNVLTHMETQDLGTLADRIRDYRAMRSQYGYDPDAGVVTVMQHTLIADNGEEIAELADRQLENYLRSAADLERRSVEGGGGMSGGRETRLEQSLISDRTVRDEMVEYAKRRLRRGASLVGSYEECEAQVGRLAGIGVNEIACLIDFLDEPDAILSSLDHIERLQSRFSVERRYRQAQAVGRFLDVEPRGS